MSGSGFHVDVEDLSQAATGIARSVDGQDGFELRGLCGEPSLYGHAGVHGALMQFCVRWSEGLDVLTDDAGEISAVLKRAAEVYRAVDDNAKHALSSDPAAEAVEG